MHVGDYRLTEKICIYDSTLRDGTQAEGISFTVEDKLKITRVLDDFGVHYIEAGNPGSNPKDLDYFRRVQGLQLTNARLAAFGSTRRANTAVEQDLGVQSLLKANTPAVTVFGKSWDFQVTDVIRTTLEENLRMISDTVRYLKENGREVIYDAEHFFDGFKSSPAYAISTVKAAAEAGADWIVLCDTNGGSLPFEIRDIVSKVKGIISVPLGIHCHDDAGMAAANSIIAAEAGVTQIQGTFNGYGERCGNTNLCTVIPTLVFKANAACIPEEMLGYLTVVSRYISEIANMAPDTKAPYVGSSAFAHKGGMHVDGVLKCSSSFEHIDPEKVGNQRKLLMSEVSGRSTVLAGIRKVQPDIDRDSECVRLIMEEMKRLEYSGYQFEGAESSFELLVRKKLGRYKKLFEVKDFKIITQVSSAEKNSATAFIKISVRGEEEITAAEGDGPVNALDNALRKALGVFYPELAKMRLSDYKVRVLDSTDATASKVRVHIESTDGERVWNTVGVSSNIIEASWIALVDSIEYMLIGLME